MSTKRNQGFRMIGAALTLAAFTLFAGAPASAARSQGGWAKLCSHANRMARWSQAQAQRHANEITQGTATGRLELGAATAAVVEVVGHVTHQAPDKTHEAAVISAGTAMASGPEAIRLTAKVSKGLWGYVHGLFAKKATAKK